MKRSLVILAVPFLILFSTMGVTQLISYLGRQRPEDVLRRAFEASVALELDAARSELSASRILYLTFITPESLRVKAQAHSRILRALNAEQVVTQELRDALPALSAGDCAASSNLEYNTVVGISAEGSKSALTCPVMIDERALALIHVTFFGHLPERVDLERVLSLFGRTTYIAFNSCGDACAEP